MVSAAVLGAATGTGLALVVAVTIVVYRYYSVKRLSKYWSTLDRWPEPSSNNSNSSVIDNNNCKDKNSPLYVLNCWRKTHRNYYAVQSQVFFRFLLILLFIILSILTMPD